MSDQFLLVLTGTVTPAPKVDIARKDPVLRRADYLQAFRFWTQHVDPRLRRIVFIENSGADLSEFRAQADRSGKEVEFVALPPSPPPPGMHYGYSELEMIDQGLSRSRLRAETTHMIKVTGRLIFPRLPKLLDRSPENFRAIVDARSRLPFRSNNHVPAQLFLTRHDFYDAYLRRAYLTLAPTHQYPHFIEHRLYEILANFKGEKDLLLRFPVNCEPVGFAGHSGEDYNRPARALIARARAICRVIAPNFRL